MIHHGGYSTLSEAYGAVVNWIMENGYEIAGAPFDLYIKTQFESLSPEDWETEVYFPIKKALPKQTLIPVSNNTSTESASRSITVPSDPL